MSLKTHYNGDRKTTCRCSDISHIVSPHAITNTFAATTTVTVHGKHCISFPFIGTLGPLSLFRHCQPLDASSGSMSRHMLSQLLKLTYKPLPFVPLATALPCGLYLTQHLVPPCRTLRFYLLNLFWLVGESRDTQAAAASAHTVMLSSGCWGEGQRKTVQK